MAVKKSNTSTTKATSIAASKTAEKKGAARIVKLVERMGSPKVREMKGLIIDAAKEFKGKPAELANFYTTMERMLVGKQKQKRENGERAIEDLQRGIVTLANVRDLLGQMELGEPGCFTTETLATFARATLADAGTEIEQSLRDLGVLKRERFGHFVPDLPEEPEAREAA